MFTLNFAIGVGYIGVYGFCVGMGVTYFQGRTRAARLCLIGLFTAMAGLEVALWTAVLQ